MDSCKNKGFLHKSSKQPTTPLLHHAFKSALLKPSGSLWHEPPISLCGSAIKLPLLQTPTFRFVWPHCVHRAHKLPFGNMLTWSPTHSERGSASPREPEFRQCCSGVWASTMGCSELHRAAFQTYIVKQASQQKYS